MSSDNTLNNNISTQSIQLLSHKPVEFSKPTIFDQIRSSTSHVIEHAQHVTINYTQIDNELSQHQLMYTTSALPPTWAQSYHYCNLDNPIATAQYILVLDSLNYCFWPCMNYEYHQLASTLKYTLDNDINAFNADNLINITPNILQKWLQPLDDKSKYRSSSSSYRSLQTTDPTLVPIPLLQHRVDSLHEIGHVLKQLYNGHFIHMIKQCNHSANTLIELLLSNFTMYRDHCINPYTGKQIHYYKRAQILIGDLYGAFNGDTYGLFTDINELTCFADYRIPQLLHHINILLYSDELQYTIDTQQLIQSGSQYENEIRSSTIQCIEYIRQQLQSKYNTSIMSIQLDWLLWERGESMLTQMRSHHKTLTVYY